MFLVKWNSPVKVRTQSNKYGCKYLQARVKGLQTIESPVAVDLLGGKHSAPQPHGKKS